MSHFSPRRQEGTQRKMMTKKPRTRTGNLQLVGVK